MKATHLGVEFEVRAIKEECLALRDEMIKASKAVKAEIRRIEMSS